MCIFGVAPALTDDSQHISHGGTMLSLNVGRVGGTKGGGQVTGGQEGFKNVFYWMFIGPIYLLDVLF